MDETVQLHDSCIIAVKKMMVFWFESIIFLLLASYACSIIVKFFFLIKQLIIRSSYEAHAKNISTLFCSPFPLSNTAFEH